MEKEPSESPFSFNFPRVLAHTPANQSGACAHAFAQFNLPKLWSAFSSPPHLDARLIACWLTKGEWLSRRRGGEKSKMDEWGGVWGRYKWRGRQWEKERPIIRCSYCPQTDSTVCMCYLCLGARVQFVLCVKKKKAPTPPSARVINITPVDKANCDTSKITNAWVGTHIERSDNCITRVNGHCHGLGSNGDVL